MKGLPHKLRFSRLRVELKVLMLKSFFQWRILHGLSLQRLYGGHKHTQCHQLVQQYFRITLQFTDRENHSAIRFQISAFTEDVAQLKKTVVSTSAL